MTVNDQEERRRYLLTLDGLDDFDGGRTFSHLQILAKMQQRKFGRSNRRAA